MNAQLTFQKSLMLLDRGRLLEGEDGLKNAIAQAEQEEEQSVLVVALVCLGDLLHELNRDSEARVLLEQVLSIQLNSNLDNVLAYELNRARELLEQMRA